MGPKVPFLGPVFTRMEINSSLGDALFPKTRQKVLAVLYGKPERSYYRNELFRRVGAGRGAVVRELTGLCEAGIITESRLGNQVHFQANPNCPIFDELRGIVIKSFGIADVLRERLSELLPNIEQAFVYGSIAKGTEDADSDIDVLIVSDDLTYSEIMATLEPSERQLHRVINPTIYSAKEYKKKRRSKAFLKRVMEQPKVWLKE